MTSLRLNSKPKTFFLTLCLFSILIGQSLYLAWHTGQTSDEPYSAAVGWPIARHADYDFLGEHPPLAYHLGALPWLLTQPRFPYKNPVKESNGAIEQNLTGNRFLYEMGNDPQKTLWTARLMVVLITCGLGLILLFWARKLYGSLGAFSSLILFIFCPNILAHGTLFTTDMAVTATFFGTLYFLGCFFENPSLGAVLKAGFFCGLTMLAKVNGMILFPLVFLFFFLFSMGKREAIWNLIPENHGKNKFYVAALCLSALILFSHKTPTVLWGPIIFMSLLLDVLISWRQSSGLKKIFWWLLGTGIWVLLFALAAQSKKYGALYQKGLLAWVLIMLIIFIWILIRKNKPQDVRMIRFLAWFWMATLSVIVLGYFDYIPRFSHGRFFSHFLRCLHMAFSHTQTYHVQCLGGSFVTCDEKYFLASILIKTPVSSLVLIATGLGFFLASKSITFMTKSLVLFSCAVYLLAASYGNHIRIGLRHALPLYPLMYLMAGSVPYSCWQIRSKPLRIASLILTGALICASIVSSLKQFPNELSYFNEWVGSTKNAAKLVADSSLSWGQDNRRLIEVVKSRRIKNIALDIAQKNDAELQYYGISWRQMTDLDHYRPAPGWYALDIVTYQSLQEIKTSWFYAKMPSAIAGTTIYLFEVI